MRPLYNGGTLHASAGAQAWFAKMGAGWDPDKLDGVAMMAEQIAAKRESDPAFADLPVIILTRDVMQAFTERIEMDEQEFLGAVDASAYTLGDDGTTGRSRL